jgi:undecaprenyl-diphosphatase
VLIEFIKIIILAIVQGIAEFLPISSSGHLAILGNLVEIDPTRKVQVIVVLHAGTLLAILVVYFKELINMIKPGGIKLITRIVIASIPIAFLGLFLHLSGLKDQMFNTVIFPGIGFFFTGWILLFGLKETKKGVEEDKESLAKISIKHSIFIGLAQAFAIFPGVSRSGSTISAALKMGIKKDDAATFSFLLAIPAIAGATFVELVSSIMKSESPIAIEPTFLLQLIVGFIVSAVVGFAALKLLLISLKKGKLSIYAYYCFTLGVGVIIWKMPVIMKFFSG